MRKQIDWQIKFDDFVEANTNKPFEWGKWDRLKASLMKLIYDKELRQRLGNRGRKLAEKTHNWEKCEERIESLYRYVKNKSTLQA